MSPIRIEVPDTLETVNQKIAEFEKQYGISSVEFMATPQDDEVLSPFAAMDWSMLLDLRREMELPVLDPSARNVASAERWIETLPDDPEVLKISLLSAEESRLEREDQLLEALRKIRELELRKSV